MLILPGSTDYYETLTNLQLKQVNQSLISVVRPSSGGLPDSITPNELREYIYGGEYNERLDEIEVEDEY